MSPWRQAFLAAALACALVGPVLGQAAYDPEIQRAFLEGARLLQAGDYEAAAQAFRAILQRTNSPRVKLELARTLFLLKQYRESRALFREVQLEADVPWQVRDNIDAFIQRIDDIVGYVRFSVSLVGDSNPRNITSQREFTIGGVRLTFQPPENNKRGHGAALWRAGVSAHPPGKRLRGLSHRLVPRLPDGRARPAHARRRRGQGARRRRRSEPESKRAPLAIGGSTTFRTWATFSRSYASAGGATARSIRCSAKSESTAGRESTSPCAASSGAG